MAIDNTGISSLEVGAPDIKLTGNQDPREPNQKFAGGGQRGWMAQELAMEIAEEEYGKDFYDLNDSLQHKIYNRALQEIDDMLIGQAQDRGGIQMASAADPMLVEQYQQYVFEMEEQGLQPMSFEEFVAQARAGMNEGGIANPRLVPHTGADLLVKKNPDGTRPKYQPPGGGATLLGSGRDYSGSDRGPREDPDRFGPTTKSPDPRPVHHPGVDKTYVPTTINVRPEPKDDDGIIKTIKDKAKSFAHNRRKKDLLRNMYHVAKGRPIQPALMAMLQGTMTEEEFEEQFGVSIDGLVGLSPMEQTNIFGDMSQFDKDRLSEMAETYGQDYISQSEFENAFYGPKGPPDLTGGGDGPQPIIYPYQTASAPGTDTPVDIDPVTGFPTEPIRFAGGISPVHDFTGIYGQRTIPMAADAVS